ncbi:unnamed protein product, partial [Prorocentrum cordatum]
EWPKLKEEILNVRRAQAAAVAAQNGVAPMDLSAFNNQGGKGRCRICNGKGHDERNCWHRKGGAGTGKGKSDSKGKSRGDSKSKGSSKGGKAKGGKAGKGPKCFNCQEHGRTSKDCPKKKKKNNLRMMEPEPEKALRGLWLAPFTVDEKGAAQKLVHELSRLGADTARASRKMVLGVDSCAATTVVPSELAPDYPTYENDMSAKGEGYRTANGGWVADEGAKELIGSVRNAGGSAQVRGIKARVAKVSKALASVSEMVDAGHRVVFDAGGSYAENKSTAVITPFQRRNNVYEMEMELMPYSKAKDVKGRAGAWSKPSASGKKLKEICMVRSHAEDAMPVVAFDYGYFGSGEDATPILFMRDSLRRYTGAEVLTCKGAARAHSANMLVKFAVNGGCKKVVFRCDSDPSIVALRDEAVKRLKKDRGMSNGLAKGAVREIRGLTRALKHAVEEIHGVTIGPEHPCLPWMVRRGAAVHNRGQVGSGGRAPYELRNGRAYKRALPAFGEEAFYLPVGKRESRLVGRWLEGVFYGIRDDSDEVYVATPKGVMRARSVKRMPLAARSDRALFSELQGAPWRPVPGQGGEGLEVPPAMAKVAADQVVPDVDLPPVPGPVGPPAPRRVYIRKGVELGRYGRAPGCRGCEAARGNQRAIMHGEECRARVEKAMADDQTFGGGARVTEAHLRSAKLIWDSVGSVPAVAEVAMGDAAEIGALLEQLGLDSLDLQEVFNPGEFAKGAPKFNLKPGVAMDLMTGWDFRLEEQRKRARAEIEEGDPAFFIMSPVCAPFSQLMELLQASGERDE